MTIYKQLLEAAKPASEFPAQTQVVELNFALGLVDAGEAKETISEAGNTGNTGNMDGVCPMCNRKFDVKLSDGNDDLICRNCIHGILFPHEYPCSLCSNGSHFKKEKEE